MRETKVAALHINLFDRLINAHNELIHLEYYEEVLYLAGTYDSGQSGYLHLF